MNLWQRINRVVRQWIAAPSLIEQYEMTLEFPKEIESKIPQVLDPFGKFKQVTQLSDGENQCPE